MGRRNYPDRAPRGTLPADQEIRKALRGHRTAAFGIRRPLAIDSREQVLDLTFDMQSAGDIPEKVQLRDQLAVTLLSQRLLSRQLQKGLVAGYNLGRTSVALTKSEGCQERNQSLVVGRGSVRIFNRRAIYVAVRSSELEDEIRGIHQVLGAAGLRGVARQEKPMVPHLTLGEVSTKHALSTTEMRHIEQTLDDELPAELEVQPWDIYPDGVLNIGRHTD